MGDPKYDDTDMTPEEFDGRIASAIPAVGSLGVFVEPSTNSGPTSRLVPVQIGVTLAQVASAPAPAE